MRDYIPNIVNVVLHYSQCLSDSQVLPVPWPLTCNLSPPQVSMAAVGMIGDLYTRASPLMSPYSDTLVQNILTILTSSEAEAGLKSVSLASLSDIVLHTDYGIYVEHIFNVIFNSDILQTKETLLEGLSLLSSLVHISGSEHEQAQSCLASYSERMLTTVIDLIQTERDLCDNAVRSVVGILGDLASRQPHIFSGLSQLNIRSIRQLVIKGQTSDNTKTKAVSVWAARQLLNIYNNNVEMADQQEGHLIVKKAKVCDEVFYDVRVTVTNKQFITQNIETENVTIRLAPSVLPPVIECSDVEATVKLPRQRNKRTAVTSTESGEQKKYKEDF